MTGVASTDNITTSTPAEFQQINVSGISTVGVLTVTTSAVVGNAVTMTSSASVSYTHLTLPTKA